MPWASEFQRPSSRGFSTAAGFSSVFTLSPPIPPNLASKRFCTPSQYTSWHPPRKNSLNCHTQLLASTSRCASETKITGAGSLSSAQEGGPAALLGILGGAILKYKREVQQLTSIVGLAHEGGGPSPFRRTQILLKSKLAVIERLGALPPADAKAAWIHWQQR